MISMTYLCKKFINKLMFPHTRDNEHFVEYLRSNGAIIGKDTRFIDPKKCHVDPGRIDYIRIGENCCLSVVSLIAHDYSWYVFADSHSDILPDGGGKIEIGNNCFIGYQACILKGTTIGDNVIIGARSVVKGNVPSNTVWAGSPAKQICTLDELYQRKVGKRISEALYRRDHIKEKKGGNPDISEMGYFSFLFLDRTMENYHEYIEGLEHNGISGHPVVKHLFFNSKPMYKSFDEFLEI